MSHKCFNGLPNCVNHGKVDTATLEVAKQYTDSQRLAYAEPGKVYTWDGDITASNVSELEEGAYMACLSEDGIDLTKVERITTRHIEYDGEELIRDENFEYTTADIEVYEEKTTGISSITINDSSSSGIVISSKEAYYEDGVLIMSKGLYALCQIADLGNKHIKAYCTSIELEGTIHPIDPKFIPPMDALILNANDKQYRIAVDETGTLTTTEVT